MLFCAYCGKSFTRKEHLERHIPSHTNVKPHRCGSCQLSFSRRDLLQRHHSTYHEVRDPTQPLTSAVPTLAGRTPIACINCASAKTGCDKQVPCSRCAEKNLPCAARFARRASKILRRIATTQDQPVLQKQNAPISQPCQLQEAQPISHETSQFHNHSESCGQTLQGKYFEATRGLNMSETASNSAFLDNNFMNYSADFIDPDLQYQDHFQWNDFTTYPQMYIPNFISPSLSGRFYSDQEISSESDNGYMPPFSCLTPSHSRNTSIKSSTESNSPVQGTALPLTPLQQAILVGEAAWPIVRCHLPEFSGGCPRTALLHLETLEHSSRHESCWARYTESAGNASRVVAIQSRTRDTILAITQGILQKALCIHRGSSKDRKAAVTASDYLALPPSCTLDLFLQNYMYTLFLENTCVAAGILDINNLALQNQVSTLLALLMIAQGASKARGEEARALAAGLTEMCRITLFDMIEKDVELIADQAMLQCACIFTKLGVWSGDKWHMDIAIGQRGMYLAMLKHSGAFEVQAISFPNVGLIADRELLWRSWLYMEGTNRLVYDWVVMDLELSIFYDTAPILQISDLETRLPNLESLWTAESVDTWVNIVHSQYPSTSDILHMHQLPPSLSALFQDFLHGTTDTFSQVLSMTQLRLLLHPLQSMIYQARQILSYFPDMLVLTSRSRGSTSSPAQLTRQTTLVRLEELQALLLRWYDLYLTNVANTPITCLGNTTLILYHLLSLSLTTSLTDLERLARKDSFENTYWDLSLRHKRCIQNSTEAMFHAGQMLRILKAIVLNDRPDWWSLVVYRAALVLWVESLARADPHFSHGEQQKEQQQPWQQQQQQQSAPLVAIDDLAPDDPVLNAWRWGGPGVGILCRANGSIVKMGMAEEILGYFIEMLEIGDSGERLVGGIRRKLMKLCVEWHSMGDVNIS